MLERVAQPGQAPDVAVRGDAEGVRIGDDADVRIDDEGVQSRLAGVRLGGGLGVRGDDGAAVITSAAGQENQGGKQGAFHKLLLLLRTHRGGRVYLMDGLLVLTFLSICGSRHIACSNAKIL